jgi:hypothetical protein
VVKARMLFWILLLEVLTAEAVQVLNPTTIADQVLVVVLPTFALGAIP